ncbi:MAG: hypothetical protein KDJ87_07085 [Rhizobiaceae bacterium]|nr:hypothetical protein [Rhizobiaceae bacterium]
MKKLIVGGLAAFMATASFATSADAGVVLKYKSGWRRPAAVVVVKPRVRVYAPRVRVYSAPCIVKKRVDAWGNVYKKRVC